MLSPIVQKLIRIAQTAENEAKEEMSKQNDQADGMKPTKKETFIQQIIPAYELSKPFKDRSNLSENNNGRNLYRN